MTDEEQYLVAWQRTLTGETGFVGAVSESGWTPVENQIEAERFEQEEAEEVVAMITKAHVATHAHLVPV